MEEPGLPRRRSGDRKSRAASGESERGPDAEDRGGAAPRAAEAGALTLARRGKEADDGSRDRRLPLGTAGGGCKNKTTNKKTNKQNNTPQRQGVKTWPGKSRQDGVSGVSPRGPAGGQQTERGERCAQWESGGVPPSLREEKHPLGVRHWC